MLDEAPAEAVLTFNEPVQLIDGSIRLFPGDDNPPTNTIIAALPADLADAGYALSYHVRLADRGTPSPARSPSPSETARRTARRLPWWKPRHLQTPSSPSA